VLNALLLIAPPAVLLADSVASGVSEPAVLAYVMIWAATLVVVAIVNRNPEPFDVMRFRFGGVFIVAFLLTMLLGAPSVFSEYYDTRSAWPYLISLLGGFIVTVLGFVLGARIPDRGERAEPAEIPARTAIWTAIVLAAAGMLGLGAYLVVAPTIPLLDALGGAGGIELTQAREESLTLLQSPAVSYLFDFSRTTLLPSAAAVLLLVGWRRRSRMIGALAALLTLIALFAAALTTEKSTVGRVILVLTIAAFISSGRRPTWRWLVPIAVVFLLFPFAISRATNSSLNSNAAIVELLGERMFRVPTNVHYHYVAYVDEDLESWLLGRTIPNLGAVSPGPAVNLTGDVQARIFPEAVVRGNANGSYLSNFYADFGMIGVLLGGLLTGLMLAWLDRVAITWLAPPFSAVFRAMTVVQLLFLTSSSVFNSVFQFPFGNLTLLVVFGFVSMIWLPVREIVRYGGPYVDMKADT
jgi:oligosaccharide repeat unit polymerase